jgi:hypothetical protein
MVMLVWAGSKLCLCAASKPCVDVKGWALQEKNTFITKPPRFLHRSHECRRMGSGAVRTRPGQTCSEAAAEVRFLQGCNPVLQDKAKAPARCEPRGHGNGDAIFYY